MTTTQEQASEVLRAGARFVRVFRWQTAATLDALANMWDGLAMAGVPLAARMAQRIDPDQPLSALDALRAHAARIRLEAVRYPIE